MNIKLISIKKLLLGVIIATSAHYGYYAVKNQPQDLSARITHDDALHADLATLTSQTAQPQNWVSSEVKSCAQLRLNAAGSDSFVPEVRDMAYDDCVEIANRHRQQAQLNMVAY